MTGTPLAFARTKSLNELEGMPLEPSSLSPIQASMVSYLRAKPLEGFDGQDFRIAMRLEVGLRHVVPLAIELLERDPLFRADMHRGDVLMAMMTIPSRFWQANPDITRGALLVAKAAQPLLPTIQSIEVLRHRLESLTDDFIHRAANMLAT